MGLPVRDSARHTYGEYLTWSDDPRYELVDGVAYAMTPAPGRRHQEVVVELLRQVANALEHSPCRVYVAPFDVRLPRGEEADADIDTVLQPDLAVICDPAKLDERGCRGAPDWVIEVLSPSTAVHDQTRKREAYERHGVPELWLVHPTDALLMIYRLREGAYGKPEVRELAGELAPEELPEVRLDLERLLGDQSL
jgi:Uma2 family endonuclease